MNKTSAGSSRLTALKTLASVLDSGSNLGDAEPEHLPDDARDRAFARHLAYGVLRWLTALEWLADRLLRKPLRQKDQDIYRLILIGLFQLWKGDGKDHASINESAECARKVGKPWAVPVINAVLRRFQREQDDWTGKLLELDDQYAHPSWLLETIRDDWPQEWQNVIEENNRPARLWVRLNRNFDAEETIKGLAECGFTVERHAAAEEAISISPAAGVASLPGFDQGRFSVQDPAAQLAPGLLKLEPGQRVLDACAAPGGKTGHLLEIEPSVKLTSLELHPSRLKRIQENLERLGFADASAIRLIAANAASPAEWWDGIPFDRILLDAPCSATGVIRRHPEIKWLRTPEQLQEAVKTQGTLLDQLWPLLKPGGILLYATCSILRTENSKQIQRFVELHPDAQLAEINATWGQETGYGRQILPGEMDMDGFFYASLRKTAAGDPPTPVG
jgi:16S rRNA (cytosine967-C5)-methyltransferase